MAAVKKIFVICIAVPLLLAALGFPGAAAEQAAVVKRAFNPFALLKSVASPIGVAITVITTLVPLLQQLLALLPK